MVTDKYSPDLPLLQQQFQLVKEGLYDWYIFQALVEQEYENVAPDNKAASQFLAQLTKEKYMPKGFFLEKFPQRKATA